MLEIHRKLGHINSKISKKLQVKFLGICEACKTGKSYNSRVQNHPRTYAERILFRVHEDITGPFKQSLLNFRYALTILDEKSRKLWGIPLDKKSKAPFVTKEFILKVQNLTDFKVAILRSDGAKEFRAKPLDELTKNGLSFETTPPYSPHTNGLIERPYRTILDKMRCLLIDANLTHLFWPEAFLYAIRLYNITPHTSLNFKTPNEVFYSDVQNRPSGETLRLDIKDLNIFGTKCYAKIHKDNSKTEGSKLENRTTPGIYLGHNPSGSGSVIYTYNGIPKLQIYASSDIQHTDLFLPSDVLREYQLLRKGDFSETTEFDEDYVDEDSVTELEDEAINLHNGSQTTPSLSGRDVQEVNRQANSEQSLESNRPRRHAHDRALAKIISSYFSIELVEENEDEIEIEDDYSKCLVVFESTLDPNNKDTSSDQYRS